jgi:hypothetical protein
LKVTNSRNDAWLKKIKGFLFVCFVVYIILPAIPAPMMITRGLSLLLLVSHCWGEEVVSPAVVVE